MLLHATLGNDSLLTAPRCAADFVPARLGTLRCSISTPPRFNQCANSSRAIKELARLKPTLRRATLSGLADEMSVYKIP